MVPNSPSQTDEVVRCLKTIRDAVDRLQQILEAPQEETMERYYRRRRELLTRIFAAGGVDQRGIIDLQDEHDTPHQWIGQQVKSGYLEKVPRPNGIEIYVATSKAVNDLELRAEAESLSTLSDEIFESDWQSEEDRAYDKL